jgi:hypothetical protein
MPTDAGTQIVVAVLSGADALADTARVTAAAFGFGDEEFVDLGTTIAACAPYGLATHLVEVTNTEVGTVIWPFVTVEGPFSDPYLLNRTTGELLQWNGLTLALYDVMVIDHYQHRVTVNGAPHAQGGPKVAEWWGIPFGTSVIEAGGSEVSGTMTLEYAVRAI